jgi:hypothetical protein
LDEDPLRLGAVVQAEPGPSAQPSSILSARFADGAVLLYVGVPSGVDCEVLPAVTRETAPVSTVTVWVESTGDCNEEETFRPVVVEGAVTGDEFRDGRSGRTVSVSGVAPPQASLPTGWRWVSEVFVSKDGDWVLERLATRDDSACFGGLRLRPTAGTSDLGERFIPSSDSVVAIGGIDVRKRIYADQDSVMYDWAIGDISANSTFNQCSSLDPTSVDSAIELLVTSR